MSPTLPMLLTLAPELAPYLFEPAAPSHLAAAEQALRAATGTDTPEAAQAVLARDPHVAAQLRVDLARVAARAAADTMATQARQATGDRASVGPGPVRIGGRADAWTAAAVSLLVLLAFSGAMWACLTHTLPPGSETVATLLLGTLASLATSVVSYWVGSSAGSAAKTELLFGGSRNQASPAGAPAAGATAQGASRA